MTRLKTTKTAASEAVREQYGEIIQMRQNSKGTRQPRVRFMRIETARRLKLHGALAAQKCT